jgi:hypothetical protein
MADGGELAKYDVSFNYNPSILSNKDAEKIAKKYTNNWEHDNDWDEVSFYVLGLSKENASKLVKELEMQDVYNIEVDKSTYADGGYMAKGGEVENLEKELRKLQRELNSGRLSTYKEGDKSEEEMNRQKERAEKMARFYEVLKLLREKDNKMAKGGGIDGQKIAKPSGWRWKNSAVTDGIISESSLYKTPSERMRKMYPDYVDFENRPTKSDKNPSKKFISLETGGQMAHGGDLEKRVNSLYSTYGFINDDYNWRLKLLEMLQNPSYEAYEIYQSLNEEQKGQVLQELYEMDNDMGSYGDGDIETSKENLEIILDDSKNAKPKFEHGGYMAHGGEIKYEVDDVVYNKVQNTVGIVRMAEERGEVKTDADGNVDVDDLEYYNPIKHKAHGLADIAPSTKKEIEERGLWKPFSKHTSKMAKGGGIEDIDMNEVESSAIFYTDESKWTTKPTIKKFADEIAEMEKLKKMLDNKEITPSKIIGTGFKSQYARPLAYRYLNERILIAKRAIEILHERGHTYANGGELHRLQQ